jgi:hypothetical protein
MNRALLLIIALLVVGCSNEGYVYPATVGKAEKACEPYGGVRRFIPILHNSVSPWELKFLGVQCQDGTVFNIEANETRSE